MINEINDVKCLKYIFDGYQGTYKWVMNQSSEKQNEFIQLYSKLLEKAYNKDGLASDYFCKQVGLPAFIFSIIFYILLGIILILLCCCSLFGACYKKWVNDMY